MSNKNVYSQICKKVEKKHVTYGHGAFGECERYVNIEVSPYDVYKETVLETLNVLNQLIGDADKSTAISTQLIMSSVVSEAKQRIVKHFNVHL